MDYRSEIELFIKMALKAGYTLRAACDGEEAIEYPSVKETLDTVCSVDESSIRFMKGNWRYTIMCVAGLGEGEAIADLATNGPDWDEWDNLHSDWVILTHNHSYSCATITSNQASACTCIHYEHFNAN